MGLFISVIVTHNVNPCYNTSINIGILLGAVSAAVQIEGGGFSHTWSGWYKKGRLKSLTDEMYNEFAAHKEYHL